jgi:hypothetical protein
VVSFARRLYLEEIDAPSAWHVGNLPNALSHLTLINVVMHLIRADQQLSYRSASLPSGSG